MTHGTGPVNDPGSSSGRQPGGAPRPTSTRKSPGARGTFQLALNPECGALQAYRLTHRDPARIAEVVLGAGVVDEGSRIALAVGLQFEAVLRRDGFAVLREALAAHGRLHDERARVLDIDAEAPGSDDAALAAKVRLTEEALRRHFGGYPTAPDLIWHPRLRLDLADVVPGGRGGGIEPITVEPDFLVTDLRPLLG